MISLFFALIAGGLPLPAASETYSIGVLAYRGQEPMKGEWDRLGEYLNTAIPEHRFDVTPVTLLSADAQLRMGTLDFLVTNPGHYIALSQSHALSVLASRMDRKSDGSLVETFGSAIIARRDSGLTRLQDVAGQRVAAVDPQAFGGFLIARKALADHGVSLYRDAEALSFVGFPMDQVVRDVLEGRADVGIVRSGLIEALAAEGALRLDDIVVLNAAASYTHPDQVSTTLYPEWPFAAMPSAPLDVRNQVALALLSARGSAAAVEAGLEDGWAAPLSYGAVPPLLSWAQATPTTGSASLPIWLALAAAVLAAALLIWARFNRTPPDQTAPVLEDVMPDHSLTPREGEVLALIAQGLSSKEIARQLQISPKTVEFHRANLLRKFDARSVGQLVAKASKGIPLAQPSET